MISRTSPIPPVLLAALSLLAAVSSALAGGGPRNVLVVVNENAEESLEIGTHYLRARDIPEANLCRVRTTTAFTASQGDFQSQIREPIRACIAASPYADRIDYIVLTRGLPIRVSIPDPSNAPTTPTSITALLMVMDTSIRDKNQGYGGPGYDFQWYPNPYRWRDEYFSHSKTFGSWGPLYLSTMLSGYWSEEAKALVDRSLASDGNPPTNAAGATFFLEDANGAANVRNGDFDGAASSLQARGYAAVHIPSSATVTGSVAASWINGGTYSGNARGEIESNTYPPGAIVDVLESFGLTPSNFTPGGQDQVPVTWWVTAGITGAQGTVFEPYNVAFPDGYLLEPYVDGFNLAETWYQGIPYAYWMNLVLGDPLCQPWAALPAVTIQQPPDGATVAGSVTLQASATTPRPAGIGLLEFFIDDELVHWATSGSAQTQWDSTSVPDGWHRFEVIAYEGSRLWTQWTEGIDLLVQNAGLQVAITDPLPGAVVAGDFPLTATASPGVAEVDFRAHGILLGTATGASPFTITASSTLLGRGANTLVAVGRTGSGQETRSAGVDVFVEKSPRVHGTLDPATGPTGGGTDVAIDGWNFEPGIRVFFGASESPSVTRADANHLVARTPPGFPGPVDVRLQNPVAPALLLTAAFTYEAVPCAVTSAVAGLRVAASAGQVSLSWAPLADPCLAGYSVFAAADPATPPAFPGNYAEVTGDDADADPSDTDFSHDRPAGGLVLYQAAGRGTDGGVGPP